MWVAAWKLPVQIMHNFSDLAHTVWNILIFVRKSNNDVYLLLPPIRCLHALYLSKTVAKSIYTFARTSHASIAQPSPKIGETRGSWRWARRPKINTKWNEALSQNPHMRQLLKDLCLMIRFIWRLFWSGERIFMNLALHHFLEMVGLSTHGRCGQKCRYS